MAFKSWSWADESVWQCTRAAGRRVVERLRYQWWAGTPDHPLDTPANKLVKEFTTAALVGAAACIAAALSAAFVHA
jgi:hypothetical protein